MAVDTAARNIAADAVAGAAAKMRIHTGDPGAGAANEVVGGGYTPQDVTWDPASGGVADLATGVAFSMPAVDAVWATLWTADLLTRIGKSLLYKDGVPTPAEFPVAGTLTITAGDVDFSA